MSYFLQTSRLQLRFLKRTDAPFIQWLVNSPGWLQYIGDKNVHDESQAIQYLENGPLKSYSDHGYGLYMVETKNQQPIGLCGFLKRPNLDHPDIGYALLPEHTSLGYGLEMVQVCLEYAFHVLHQTKIYAICMPANRRSIHLLEKAGMQLTNRVYVTEKQEELLLYQIT